MSVWDTFLDQGYFIGGEVEETIDDGVDLGFEHGERIRFVFL